jgi:hypothetical protein
MRATRRRGLHLLQRRCLGGGGHAHVADTFNPSDDAGAAGVFEYRFGDGAGSDARSGFAGGRTAPAFDGADAILGVVGEVGVRRTIGRLHLGVGLRALVAVADDDGDG